MSNFMTLDEIISNKTKDRKTGTVKRESTRTQRSAKPYEQTKETRKKSIPLPKDISIKFLVSNLAVGMMIGKGGAKIKKFQEATNASINVSSQENLYPGTDFRIVQISGNRDRVSLAQAMIWEVVAYEASSLDLSSDGVDWLPENKLSHQFEDIPVSARIVIPASSAGTIIGRAGSIIRSLMEETKAHVQISDKLDADTTQERVLTISGTTAHCSLLASKVLTLLANSTDDTFFLHNMPGAPDLSNKHLEEVSPFPTRPRRSNDARPLHSNDARPLHSNDARPLHSNDTRPLHSNDTRPRRSNEARGDARGDARDGGFAGFDNKITNHAQVVAHVPHVAPRILTGRRERERETQPPVRTVHHSAAAGWSPRGGAGMDLILGSSGGSGFAEMVSAQTIITLAVADNIVGGIFGPKGAVLKEVTMLSGAVVAVSNRGAFIEGTTNRTVTITGSPAAAQTACTMITQLAQQFVE